MKLLVRNKVKDAERWKRVFDTEDTAAAEHGLKVLHVWRSDDEADQVWFLIDVTERKRAEAFMARPESAKVGEKAGAIDGEFWFLNEFD